MRPVLRLGVVLLCYAALFISPVFGGGQHAHNAVHAHGKVLGIVSQTSLGHIDQTDARMGSDVYSCEDLSTDDGGTMRVRISGGQIFLATQSNAELEDENTEIEVLADSGTIGFSEPSTGTLSIRTPAGMVRAEGGSAAAGEITYKGTNELIITAMRGNLTLDSDGELRTIPEGKSADVTFQDALSQACHEPAALEQASTHPKIDFLILIPAALAIPSYILWQDMTESNSKPSN
jgi:hypothetical protein